MAGMDLEILETTPVAYRCYCSRERVESTLISLGRKELGEIVDEGKPIDISCQFCDTIYTFTPPGNRGNPEKSLIFSPKQKNQKSA